MKANEVIRIGRNRKRLLSLTAAKRSLPESSIWRANSTIRMAVFAGQSHEHHEADLGENVVVHSAKPNPRQRREHAHRDDENDRQRKRPAFVKRRENEKNKKHAKRENECRGIASDDLLVGERGPLVAKAIRQRPAWRRLPWS